MRVYIFLLQVLTGVCMYVDPKGAFNLAAEALRPITPYKLSADFLSLIMQRRAAPARFYLYKAARQLTANVNAP